MSGKAKTKKAGTKKKAQRATSNVFAMFDQQQIQEFKEAFGMIDQDRDGFIKETDLKDMFASLGTEKSKDYIEEMLGEAAGPLNFTMFLTIMGEKLNGTDPEDMIRNAFASFDPAGSGILNEDRLRPLLKGMGERFTEEECEEMFHLANADDDGNFNYVEFVKTIKHGSKDD